MADTITVGVAKVVAPAVVKATANAYSEVVSMWKAKEQKPEEIRTVTNIVSVLNKNGVTDIIDIAGVVYHKKPFVVDCFNARVEADAKAEAEAKALASKQ